MRLYQVVELLDAEVKRAKLDGLVLEVSRCHLYLLPQCLKLQSWQVPRFVLQYPNTQSKFSAFTK